jgi:hypothetical protein
MAIGCGYICITGGPAACSACMRDRGAFLANACCAKVPAAEKALLDCLRQTTW